MLLSLCASKLLWKSSHLSCSCSAAHTEPHRGHTGEKGIMYKVTKTFLLKPRTNAEPQNDRRKSCHVPLEPRPEECDSPSKNHPSRLVGRCHMPAKLPSAKIHPRLTLLPVLFVSYNTMLQSPLPTTIPSIPATASISTLLQTNLCRNQGCNMLYLASSQTFGKKAVQAWIVPLGWLGHTLPACSGRHMQL